LSTSLQNNGHRSLVRDTVNTVCPVTVSPAHIFPHSSCQFYSGVFFLTVSSGKTCHSILLKSIVFENTFITKSLTVTIINIDDDDDNVPILFYRTWR